MARPSPTCSAISATCSSMMPRMVQSWRQPAATRNRRSTSRPDGVCATSGWNCTPYRPRRRSSTAATGEAAVRAVTVNPGGARVQVSPCDIHTCCGEGSPASSVPPGTPAAPAAPGSGSRSSAVPPYSPTPVRATVPPNPATMSWNP